MANDAIVPEIWAFEIANNIFVSYSKRKRISERQITEFLSLLRALPIRVESQSLWANVDLESLARRQVLRPTTPLIWTSRCVPVSPSLRRMNRFGGQR